ncbi:MAG TPA: PIG-L deacetylase family protein [Caldimonas sp.]|nr:PIG-L deacetylase family protein [Caldimonas sp.]
MQTIVNRLRSAFARRFLLSVRRATHRLPVQLETLRRQRVMVVAPHMDDEVIGCGGTLLLHRTLRSEVRVVFVSDSSGAVGDPGLAENLRGIRRAEMMTVSDALALASVVELGFADGSLMSHEEAIASRLADELRSFRPAQVLCPFPADGHADHQATAVALALATRLAGWQGEVLAYEVWSTLWPNMAVDIGTVADEKARLIRMYASEMGDRDYAGAVLGLNRYRGMQHRVEVAEAFHRCDAAQFRALTACLESFDS